MINFISQEIKIHFPESFSNLTLICNCLNAVKIWMFVADHYSVCQKKAQWSVVSLPDPSSRKILTVLCFVGSTMTTGKWIEDKHNIFLFCRKSA